MLMTRKKISQNRISNKNVCETTFNTTFENFYRLHFNQLQYEMEISVVIKLEEKGIMLMLVAIRVENCSRFYIDKCTKSRGTK